MIDRVKYTYEFNKELNVIIIRLFGELYKDEIALMDIEFRLKANELNCNIIIDFRETHNHIHIADAYFWFDKDHHSLLSNLKHIPVVQIINEEDESFFNFFELTAQNKGAKIKICKDEISAVEWLAQYS